ncbi:MAG: hypothetical protein ACT4PT_06355 [Methanobacteriota archaeon]
MTRWPRADDVRVAEGFREDFFKRHKKDQRRAKEAWGGLVARRDALLRDVQMGEPIPKNLRPRAFRAFNTLYLIPALPHRFRAVYEVSSASPQAPVILTIVWIGDHAEYDELFGCRTS